MFKVIIGIFGFLLFIFAIAWLSEGNDFFIYKVFAPKKAAVQREVFENSPSYNQGMIQELSNMQYQYLQAKPDAQAALGSIILHRASAYGEEKLPPDLHEFVETLKNKQASYQFPATQN